MKVKNHMTGNLVVIEKGQSVEDAKRLLAERRFRHLPVVENGKVVGVVSDRDVNRSQAISEAVKTLCGIETPEDLRIEEIMSDSPVCVKEDDDLKTAAAIMMEKKIGCLLVMDNGKLNGIITATDILKVFVELAG